MKTEKVMARKPSTRVRPRPTHKGRIRWKLRPAALVKGVDLIVEGRDVGGANGDCATLYDETGRAVAVPLAALCALIGGGLEAGVGVRGRARK